jgi:hypothetical protein
MMSTSGMVEQALTNRLATASTILVNAFLLPGFMWDVQ